MRFLNKELILNPLNWFIIVTMVLFSVFLMAMISPASE